MTKDLLESLKAMSAEVQLRLTPPSPDTWWLKYKVDVPTGRSGRWEIDHYEPHMLELVRDIRTLRTAIRPGVYTVLYYHGKKTKTIMSDTPAEIDEHLRPITSFSGRVLITGLGIGMVLQGLLMRKQVQHVTVLEKSRDVIKLVKPHYEKKFGVKRFTVICADAFKWKVPKGQTFDYVWHDIWPMISSSNLEPMRRLEKKYEPHATYQGFWCKELCRKMQFAEREVKKHPNKFAHILGG
jgi:hypothetical protein